MKTFIQYLTERFHRGMKVGSQGYAEIFKNPDSSELRDINNSHSSREIGAIATDHDLYAWDRDRAMHAEVRAELGLPGGTSMPLYLNYDANTRTLGVRLASYSAAGNILFMKPDEVLAYCQKHPVLKKYKLVDGREMRFY